MYCVVQSPQDEPNEQKKAKTNRQQKLLNYIVIFLIKLLIKSDILKHIVEHLSLMRACIVPCHQLCKTSASLVTRPRWGRTRSNGSWRDTPSRRTPPCRPPTPPSPPPPTTASWPALCQARSRPLPSTTRTTQVGEQVRMSMLINPFYKMAPFWRKLIMVPLKLTFIAWPHIALMLMRG